MSKKIDLKRPCKGRYTLKEMKQNPYDRKEVINLALANKVRDPELYDTKMLCDFLKDPQKTALVPSESLAALRNKELERLIREKHFNATIPIDLYPSSLLQAFLVLKYKENRFFQSDQDRYQVLSQIVRKLNNPEPRIQLEDLIREIDQENEYEDRGLELKNLYTFLNMDQKHSKKSDVSDPYTKALETSSNLIQELQKNIIHENKSTNTKLTMYDVYLLTTLMNIQDLKQDKSGPITKDQIIQIGQKLNIPQTEFMKTNANQLTPIQYWRQLISTAMRKWGTVLSKKAQALLREGPDVLSIANLIMFPTQKFMCYSRETLFNSCWSSIFPQKDYYALFDAKTLTLFIAQRIELDKQFSKNKEIVQKIHPQVRSGLDLFVEYTKDQTDAFDVKLLDYLFGTKQYYLAMEDAMSKSNFPNQLMEKLEKCYHVFEKFKKCLDLSSQTKEPPISIEKMSEQYQKAAISEISVDKAKDAFDTKEIMKQLHNITGKSTVSEDSSFLSLWFFIKRLIQIGFFQNLLPTIVDEKGNLKNPSVPIGQQIVQKYVNDIKKRINDEKLSKKASSTIVDTIVPSIQPFPSVISLVKRYSPGSINDETATFLASIVTQILFSLYQKTKLPNIYDNRLLIEAILFPIETLNFYKIFTRT